MLKLLYQIYLSIKIKLKAAYFYYLNYIYLFG